MSYYFDILECGAWLCFDRFGIESIASDKLRLASLLGLMPVGFDRIMLSHDSLQCWPGRDTGVLDGMVAASPNWDIAHISRNILPAMREAGVSQDGIDTLKIKTPCSHFKK